MTLNSKMSEKMNLPLLFPCASRVKVPQLGAEDSSMTLCKPKRLPPFLQQPGGSEVPISRDYIHKISTDMSFSDDVVKDRCFYMMPYSDKYFLEALQLGDLIAPRPTTRIPVGRHNNRLLERKHMPCHLKKLTKSSLKSEKRKLTEKAPELHDGNMSNERLSEFSTYDDKEEETKSQCPHGGKSSSQVDTEPIITRKTRGSVQTDRGTAVCKDVLAATPVGISQLEWDAYLMSILSSTTATWIVHQRMSPSSQQVSLNQLLTDWHGPPEHTDLIRDDISETEFDVTKQQRDKKPQKQWKKSEATLIGRVYENGSREESPTVSPTGHAADPYSEDNKAPFYRQPAGLRRHMKHKEKEYAAAINATARDIEVCSYQPPPPITLKDIINPKVGDKFYETTNLYQQEKLTGVRQVFDHSLGDKTTIAMGSQNKYKKQLQSAFPRPPDDWFQGETQGKKPRAPSQCKKVPKVERGIHKWKGLPEPIDDTADVLKVTAPGYESADSRSPDPIGRRNTKQNPALMKILEEWRSQWHLSGQYADSTPDDLIQDMMDIQAHVRLKAVATVSKAVSYKPPIDPGIKLEHEKKAVDPVEELPLKLFRALEFLLDDKHDQVKKAAAITLYSMDKPTPKAEVIMREALRGENSADRWAAAQCLAHFGIGDSIIIGEIIQQLMATEDSVKHERAIALLSKVSANSMLVHSMVAEHLNSSSWRHKVIACKVFPTLHANINKDVTQKLTDLMWNDWHSEVRSAAAQALGKTGHGRAVHEDLREKILHGPERMRVEAISRIGHLGIMTARLLPAFLQCFDDSYVSVRTEVCITAGNLAIEEEEVLKKLIHLATYDTAWKVKALAVQALGKIGVATLEVRECLVWALRYEERPAVRAEACHSLMALGQEDIDIHDMVDILQDRLLVESSSLVRDEITSALKQLGISSLDDLDMVAEIKDEVRKLCTRNIIASQITLNEAVQTKVYNKARMIYQQPPDEQPKELQELQHCAREDIMKTLKSRTASPASVIRPSSRTHSSSKGSTPDLSRESTMTTPTVEKELRDILSRDNTALSSAETGSVSTPRTKTRTTSSAVSSGGESLKMSHDVGDDENDAVNVDEGGDDIPQDADASKDTTVSFSGGAEMSSKTLGEKDAADLDETREGIASLTEDADMSSKVSDGKEIDGLDETQEGIASLEETTDLSKNLELQDSQKGEIEAGQIPQPLTVEVKGSAQVMNTQYSLPATPRDFPGALLDGRRSILTPGLSPSKRSLISREIQQERDKIQHEASLSYNDLDARYADMISDLDRVDNAFQQSKSRENTQINFEMPFVGHTPNTRSKVSSVGLAGADDPASNSSVDPATYSKESVPIDGERIGDEVTVVLWNTDECPTDDVPVNQNQQHTVSPSDAAMMGVEDKLKEELSDVTTGAERAAASASAADQQPSTVVCDQEDLATGQPSDVTCEQADSGVEQSRSVGNVDGPHDNNTGLQTPQSESAPVNDSTTFDVLSIGEVNEGNQETPSNTDTAEDKVKDNI